MDQKILVCVKDSIPLDVPDRLKLYKLNLQIKFDYTYTLHNTLKELSLRHKLRFSNPHIFVAQCRRPQIFQTMNSDRSNNQSLKY